MKVFLVQKITRYSGAFVVRGVYSTLKVAQLSVANSTGEEQTWTSQERGAWASDSSYVITEHEVQDD